MIIYIDVLIVVNLVITYFMLITSAVLSGYTYNRKRVVIASVTGALFCLFIFIQNSNLFIEILVKILSLVICSVVAFWRGKIKGYLSQTICFVTLNILLAGVVLTISYKSKAVYYQNMFFYFDINPIILVLSSAFIYFIIVIFSMIKDSFSSDKIYVADLIFSDFSIKGLQAFYDSGLKIKDVVSNKDIMILSYNKTLNHISKDLKKDLESFFANRYDDIKVPFIPVFYNTISGQGIIPAIKCKKAVIDNIVVKNVLAAFVHNDLSDNVSAIFGYGIKKQL